MTVSDGIHLLHQDSHSCAIDGYDELVFILRIRIVLTLHDMDSEGCLYPSSWDNLSTDLGCILCINSSANFLHVHSTKHVWCMTALLHADVSHVALRKKGDENDKGRANKVPSSCQNNDEPSPGGTWARQRCRLHDYSMQTGKVSGGGCQT